MKELVVSVRLDEDLMDKVRFNAKLNGRTLSNYISNCLSNAVHQQESLEARISRLETVLIKDKKGM